MEAIMIWCPACYAEKEILTSAPDAEAHKCPTCAFPMCARRADPDELANGAGAGLEGGLG